MDVPSDNWYAEMTGKLLGFTVRGRPGTISKGAAAIDFAIPADLAADRPDQIEAARASQQALFESRRETQTAREQILAKRVGQMQEQIAGLRAVITV